MLFALSLLLLAAPGHSGQVLSLNLATEPATLDPRQQRRPAEAIVQYLLLEGLLRVDLRGKVAWGQAEQLSVLPGGKTYRFTMRRGAKWSDGRAVTAAHFANAWKSALHPDFPCPHADLFAPIGNAQRVKRGAVAVDALAIEAVDPQTLLVHLERPCSYFLQRLTCCPFLPLHPAQDSSRRWISNGPFLLEHWIPKHHLQLRKNPHYWDAAALTIDRIRIAMIAQPTVALRLFRRGHFDLLGGYMSALPEALLPQLKSVARIHPVNALTFCALNVTAFPFHNPELRKAFAYAIDRHKLTSRLHGLGRPACRFLPPTSAASASTLAYQPERARAHLAQASKQLARSKRDLQAIVYTYCASERGHLLAQELQQQWQATLGITVQLRPLSSQALSEALTRGDFQIAQTSCIAPCQDPASLLTCFAERHAPHNASCQKEPPYRSLLQQALATDDLQQRTALLLQAEAGLLQALPGIPLYQRCNAYLAGPRIDAARLTELTDFCLAQLQLKGACPTHRTQRSSPANNGSPFDFASAGAKTTERRQR